MVMSLRPTPGDENGCPTAHTCPHGRLTVGKGLVRLSPLTRLILGAVRHHWLSLPSGKHVEQSLDIHGTRRPPRTRRV